MSSRRRTAAGHRRARSACSTSLAGGADSPPPPPPQPTMGTNVRASRGHTRGESPAVQGESCPLDTSTTLPRTGHLWVRRLTLDCPRRCHPHHTSDRTSRERDRSPWPGSPGCGGDARGGGTRRRRPGRRDRDTTGRSGTWPCWNPSHRPPDGAAGRSSPADRGCTALRQGSPRSRAAQRSEAVP